MMSRLIEVFCSPQQFLSSSWLSLSSSLCGFYYRDQQQVFHTILPRQEEQHYPQHHQVYQAHHIDDHDKDSDLWLIIVNFLTTNCLLNDRMIFTLSLSLTNILLFYSFNLIFYWMETYNILSCYRIPRNEKKTSSHTQQLQQELIWSCLQDTAISNFITQPLFTYWIGYPLLIDYFHLPFHVPLPSIMIVLRDWIVMYMIHDTMFYWIHRCILHHPFLYKFLHKQHHMFHEPIGICASYATVGEALLAGVIPMVICCYLVKPHFVIFLLFIGWHVLVGVETHSGYAFPFSPFTFTPFPVTERHDFHHSHNTGCYGGWFWDWVCGTDKTFNEYQKARRSLD